MRLTGSRTCRNPTYTLSLASPFDARTSLCHCRNCKKAFSTNYGLTAKVPVSSFAHTAESGAPTEHVADSGSGTLVHREFCGKRGSFILEYGVGGIFEFLVFGNEGEGRGGEEVGLGSLMGARGGGRYGVTGAVTATATATIANMVRALFGSGTRERVFLVYLCGEPRRSGCAAAEG